MITMRDIAVRAGVSRSTVSFVLNDKHSAMGVNEDTRRRVLEVASELGYRRNELARAVVTGKNRVFGFVVPGFGLESEVVSRILAGVMDEAEARHYAVQVIRLARPDDEIIRRCVELRPTGLLCIQTGPETLRHLRQEVSRFGIPIAVLDSSPQLEGGSRVLSDDLAGCRQAIDHLADLGHARIAYVGGDPKTVVSRLREEGYLAAMAGRHLPVLGGYVENGYWNAEATEAATVRLLEDPEDAPSAIFCADDKTAMVVCRTARRLGRSVPGDLSVVGFADLAMAAYADPPLTTVAQPFPEMGRVAVRRLLAAAAGETPPPEDPGVPLPDELVPTHLVVRRSTAAAHR